MILLFGVMAITVGINGFGRIGRIVFRTCIQNSKIQLSAINDPAIDIEYICYLIKFDSTHGKFKGTVSCTKDGILINDCEIKVFREKLPSTIPWHLAGVQYVVEASGMFTCMEKASGHLKSEGVRRVLVTAPSIDVPMVVLGVNDHKVDTSELSFELSMYIPWMETVIDQRILSCVSSTLYCLAPIIKILEDNFGVEEGFVTSIHAMTPSLKPLDGLCLKGKHWRDHRSIHQNIIPATTGACKALGKLIPRVKDKMTGLAFRVPIANVSVLDMSIRLQMNTTLHKIFQLVEEASKNIFRNIINLSNEAAVSSDFIGDNHSCIVDVNSTLQLKPNFYKIICWYENEYSYACRVLDTLFFSEAQFRKLLMTLSKPLPIESPQFKQKKQENRFNVIRIGNTEDTKIIRNSREVRSKLSSEMKMMRESSLNSSVDGHSSPTRDNGWDSEKTPIKITQHRKSTISQIGSFFHSCTTFAPKVTNKTVTSAHEPPENVGKEFSRIANTDELLKKSYDTSNMITTDQLNKKIAPNGRIGQVGPDDPVKEKEKSLKRVYNRPQKEPTYEMCGDYDSKSVFTHQTYTSSEELSCCGELATKSKSDFNIVVEMEKIEKSILNTIELKTSKKSTSLIQKVSLVKQQSQDDNIPNHLNFKGSIEVMGTKAMIKELHLKYKEHLNRIYIANERMASQFVGPDEVPHKHSENNIHVGRFTEQKCNAVGKSQQSRIGNKCLHGRYEEKDLTTYLCNKHHNMGTIDKELKKRNMVLKNDLQQNTESNESDNFSNFGNDHLHKREDSGRYLDNGKLETVSKCKANVHSYPGMRCSPANTATTLSKEEKHTTYDLYDKLDSNSATDSNHSFDMNIRKSQIINFSDLSNSLEDLARLDKICKIIEISDELSDQLFSSLDQTESRGVHDKQWSFRDLCKRIKLDDFCNQVFGKSGV